jgi:murein DD-endopeptidase MepM/ murein hydrolase activator NlpD
MDKDLLAWKSFSVCRSMNLLCPRNLLIFSLLVVNIQPVWAESPFLERAKTRQDPANGEFDAAVAIPSLTQNAEGIWTSNQAHTQPAPATTSLMGEKTFSTMPVSGLVIEDAASGRRITLGKNDSFPILGNTADPSIANEKILYPFNQAFPVSIPYGLRAHPVSGAPSLYRGVGIAAPKGTPVLAAFSGSVLKAGAMGNLGNGVILGHGNDYRTRYGHLEKVLVRPGTFVVQGEKIGLVGDTGQADGSLLHFELWKRKKKEWTAKNPTAVLQFDAKTYKTAMKFQSISSRSIRGVKGVPTRLPQPPKLLK